MLHDQHGSIARVPAADTTESRRSPASDQTLVAEGPYSWR
jgi:hypothetical protein